MAKATGKKAQEQANLAALEQAVAAKAAENSTAAGAKPAAEKAAPEKASPAAKAAPAQPAAAKVAPVASTAKAAAKPDARRAAKPAAQKPAQPAVAAADPYRGMAIGQVETRGLVAAIEAADAMLKTAQVYLVGTERIGSGLVTVLVRGEVSAVTAAVARGSEAASRLGEVVSTNVIARPVDDLNAILPQG